MRSIGLRYCLWCWVLIALVLCGLSQRVVVAETGDLPFAAVLADDDYTRGDWIGTYGTYAYILCGMRSPQDLSGGAGYPQPEVSGMTGDPTETARAWRSSAPAENDRSVLLEPSGIKRTPASWDDHGEVRPIGEGPNLHIWLSIPEGPCLLSLYFFEIDWIQYRTHRIRILAGSPDPKPLLETQADNFFKGKYKRFLVAGPTSLLIIIERGTSPNAQVSGVFLDRLSFPDLHLMELDSFSENLAMVSLYEKPVVDIASTSQVPLEHLAQLVKTSEESAAADYLRAEYTFFKMMERAEKEEPETYYSLLESTWQDAEQRLIKALPLLGDSQQVLEALMLRYHATHAQCNFEGARRTVKEIADSLRERALSAEDEWPSEAKMLHDYSRSLISAGRRAEAGAMLEAYAAVCLKQASSVESKQRLVAIAKDALRGGVPLPIAKALDVWRERQGSLTTEEGVLLGGLYYAGGENNKALAVYKTVEREMPPGSRHRWLLIAMLSAYLREDRVGEASTLMKKLVAEYPNAAEINEANYHFGAYYFNKRKLDEAEKWFRDMKKTALDESYAKMAEEYLRRIEHLKNLEKQRRRGP